MGGGGEGGWAGDLGDRKSPILFYGAFSSFAIDKWFIELTLFQKTYPTLKNS